MDAELAAAAAAAAASGQLPTGGPRQHGIIGMLPLLGLLCTSLLLAIFLPRLFRRGAPPQPPPCPARLRAHAVPWADDLLTSARTPRGRLPAHLPLVRPDVLEGATLPVTTPSPKQQQNCTSSCGRPMLAQHRPQPRAEVGAIEISTETPHNNKIRPLGADPAGSRTAAAAVRS